MTKQFTKGEITRLHILEKARIAFNKYGIQIGLDEIAKHCDITKSMITNHFGTKNSLLLAIDEQYVSSLSNLMGGARFDETFTLQSWVELNSNLLGLQFEYRSSIYFSILNSQGESKLIAKNKKTYEQFISLLKHVINLFVTSKIIKEEIFDDENFDTFIYLFISSLLYWLIDFETYHEPNEYKSLKKLYLKGMFSNFLPYFTAKGIKEFQNLKF